MLTFRQNISPVRIIFFTSILFLAAMTVFSYKKNLLFAKEAILVNHTNVVKFELEHLLSDIKDAEGGARAFYLSGIKDFLVPYNAAANRLPALLKRLDTLLSDNPKQLEHLASLKQSLNAKLDFLAKEVAQQKPGTFDTVIVLRSRTDMLQIRDRISLMQAEEDRLLRDRTNSFYESVNFAPTVTIILAVSSLVLLIFSYLKISNELHKSQDLQKRLQESNNTLEKSNTELSQFAYIASHDLQEPLRKIQTFISRINDTEEHLSEKGKDYFSRVDKSAKRMQRLILDILAYSRLNKSDNISESTDLNEALSAATEQLEEFAKEKNAVIKAEILPSLNVVRYQFEQLFVNLIGNALKFSNPGNQNVVTISADKVPGASLSFSNINKEIEYHRIRVSDTGIGFEPQYKERIFKIFHRLNAKEAYEGNGIGLSIVKKIVDAHGGFISAEGKPGTGAVFSVYLPA